MRKHVVAAAALAALALAAVAAAATTTVKVTPANLLSLFTVTDIRPTSSVAFEEGPGTAPAGRGSIELRTVDGTAKQSYLQTQQAGTLLTSIDALGYATYRDPASTANPAQVTALNMQVDVNGAAEGGFTTLVFEPVYTYGNPTPGTWQTWDAFGDAKWWSTRAIPGVCAFDCFVAWDDIVAANPAAVVLAYGINQGSGNPGLVANADALTIGVAGSTTVYDFEPLTGPPTAKDDCKDGGWQQFDNPSFKNQGDCVSFVEAGS